MIPGDEDEVSGVAGSEGAWKGVREERTKREKRRMMRREEGGRRGEGGEARNRRPESSHQSERERWKRRRAGAGRQSCGGAGRRGRRAWGRGRWQSSPSHRCCRRRGSPRRGINRNRRGGEEGEKRKERGEIEKIGRIRVEGRGERGRRGEDANLAVLIEDVSEGPPGEHVDETVDVYGKGGNGRMGVETVRSAWEPRRESEPTTLWRAKVAA